VDSAHFARRDLQRRDRGGVRRRARRSKERERQREVAIGELHARACIMTSVAGARARVGCSRSRLSARGSTGSAEGERSSSAVSEHTHAAAGTPLGGGVGSGRGGWWEESGKKRRVSLRLSPSPLPPTHHYPHSTASRHLCSPPTGCAPFGGSVCSVGGEGGRVEALIGGRQRRDGDGPPRVHQNKQSVIWRCRRRRAAV